MNDLPYLGCRKGSSIGPHPRHRLALEFSLSPCPAHVCFFLGRSQSGRELRAGVGQRPVALTGLWGGRQLSGSMRGQGVMGNWCRSQVVVSAPGCWHDLERDSPPCLQPVGSPSEVTPLARPPFLFTPGRGVCALSRSGRVIANVGVVSVLFTKPCHVYRLLFDSLSHLTSLQRKSCYCFIISLQPRSGQ